MLGLPLSVQLELMKIRNELNERPLQILGRKHKYCVDEEILKP